MVTTATTTSNETRQRGHALSTVCVRLFVQLQFPMRLDKGSCVYVFIKLYITAQAGPAVLTLQCYTYGSTLWGIIGYDNHVRV